ncbi:ribonuclease R [Paraglaciecola sp. L1A13]|uniref:ribonuclease R n=1 Tax=Paraglaciecola sp. L1A13 TaxID=2686359 RepID=UPI00131C762C|nr:ribonuclease R [Paraglaciecola sp. L1A13]
MNQTAQLSPIRTYDNPIPGREFILSLFSSLKKHLNREQIADALALNSPQEKEALRRRLRAMERDGQLSFQRKGYQLIDPESLVSGTISIHPDGFGFVTYSDSEKDLFLPKNQLNHVFDGDVVQVLIEPGKNAKRAYSNLLKVLQRNTTHIVGTLVREGEHYFLLPDDIKLAQNINVEQSTLKQAQVGQYVNARITHYPNFRQNTQVEIIEVIGNATDAGIESKLALHRHGISDQWDKTLLDKANAHGCVVSQADKAQRIDYRSLPFVTIDGADAKDFDDAVYCEKNQAGDWRLLVAIADVSHYVLPNDALDIEAQERATSIYLPDQVVPMLPETLSNGLCSLNPHQDRLVMVCEITISAKGVVTQADFSEGLIQSHARLTYNQANALVFKPNSKPAKTVSDPSPAIVPHIKNLHALFQVLSKQRKRRGAIEFETRELALKLNKHKTITSISPVKRNDAHRMIEEFMLCANVATAQFLQRHKIPSLFRVHAGPQQKKLTALRAFLSEKGLILAGDDNPSSHDYNDLLKKVSHRADARLIQTLLLRSQSQAEYSSVNQGHFGLAYEAYAHFTSPIRRYPDLLTHRAIRAKLRSSKPASGFNWVLRQLKLDKLASKTISKTAYPYTAQDVEQLSTHCSGQSRLADTVSREVENALMCKYMQPFIGDSFDASISGMNNTGFFVSLENSGAEGLVHITSLKGEAFTFDGNKQQISNQQHTYHIGDHVSVVLKNVDLRSRKMSFEMA